MIIMEGIVCTSKPKKRKFILHHFYQISLLFFLPFSIARPWPAPKLYSCDPNKQFIIEERENAFRFTTHPSSRPTSSPSESAQPSSNPTSRPTLSFKPSKAPTTVPSHTPSSSPSVRPTSFPTNSPSARLPYTFSPAEDYPIDVPNSTDSDGGNSVISYFNYNPHDTKFGPGVAMHLSREYNTTESDDAYELVTKEMNYTYYNGSGWPSVRNNYEYNYWKGFEGMNRTLGNKCEGGPTKHQSPIDLCETHVNAECFEHHQIRNRGGEYNLNDTQIQLKILPSKLRIEYSRHNTGFDDENGHQVSASSSRPFPPRADFAHNWHGYIPVVHIDIKIPSEHTICSKRFAGEYQIYFYHAKRRLPIVQSVLMEIHPTDRSHKHFQKVLNEFQAIVDWKKLQCLENEREAGKRQERFIRRMENFVMGGLDSDEVSLVLNQSSPTDEKNRVVPINDESSQSGRGMSTILDEPQQETKRRRKLVRKAMEKANNPFLDESSADLDIAANANKKNKLRKTKIDEDFSEYHYEHRHLNTSATLDALSDTWNASEAEQFAQMPAKSRTVQGIGVSPPENHNPSTTPSPIPSSYPASKHQSTDSPLPHSPLPTATNSSTTRRIWNPFYPRILNSIYFYGYQGSLTEPPCSEWVSWRVLDVPMQISTKQWFQMRDILFGQVDGNCKRTSVHWKGGVARPAQSLNNRPLWKCTPKDYLSDVEKAKSPKS